MSELQRRVEGCRICVEHPTGPPLPHEPRPVVRLSPTARLCVAGQAPGARVHASGQPFDDRSGERLRAWMGIDRPTFYDTSRIAIVPMGFCFPGTDENGSDRPPRRECRLAWHDTVFHAMPQIELVIAIGAYAQAYHLGPARAKTMTATVEQWQRHLRPNAGRAILPIPHPSWRNTRWLRDHPWFEAEVVPVLQAEVQRLLEA